MYLKSIELSGFKSFGKKTALEFGSKISAIVGPNGSGKSNVAEGFRFVLGEQSMKSLRSKRGEDLIWGGSPALPRMNRGAVKVVFDNTTRGGKRLLDIDFSEVVVERIVHRDGANEYLLNGSLVRLKDVIRLLAGANIGGSGYQIISQGEADRILNASPRERREMVEDALGLKLYQHKKAESERKLEETAINIEKTKSLRREIAPHLKFLQTQVEKIEKAREMKGELAHKLGEYLARESAYLTAESARIADDMKVLADEIRTLDAQLKEVQKAQGARRGQSAGDELLRTLESLQKELTDARRKREDIVRELGRAEGALEATSITVEAVVPAPHVREFAREITEAISEAEHSNDITALKNLLVTLRNRIKSFIDGLSGAAPITNKEAEDTVVRLTSALEKAEADESRLTRETERVRTEMTTAREASFAAEKDEVAIEGKLREAQSKMVSRKAERDHVADERKRFEEEVREGIALVGLLMQGWDKAEVPDGALAEDRSEQEKRRRAIERLKIKIEESGVGGSDAVLREYQQTGERDQFLARELQDLEKSAASLEDIIVELEKMIDARFTDGLKHINEALGGFFTKLFGGGTAKLFVEEPRRKKRSEDDVDGEDEIADEGELCAGLSIDVSLPRKKIRGLEILSGGERALTSIALIFSMSQVNPPPFLILDETDAALDEANSRRYADMIQELGKKSQLIVITHNRATMSAAGELYGVTMGQDGVSKVLAVKLEEAKRVAK
jgi:chromosome segregation protein